MTRDELLDILDTHCGLCGCGDVLSATALLLDLLEAGEMTDAGLWEEAEETLNDVLGTTDDIGRDLPLFWLHSTGLVAHGYNLMTYGLTDLGDDVLEALREYGAEGVWTGEDEEPDIVAELVGEPDRSLN